LALGGAHPYADPAFACLEGVDPSDPGAFLRCLESIIGESLDPETRQLLLQNDRAAVIASLRQRVALDEVVSQIRVPCWLFAGTADRRYELIVRAQRAIPGAELLSVPGLGHWGTFTSAARVLPGLLAHLEAADAFGRAPAAASRSTTADPDDQHS
jgi:pimeloyl-ACP methyl ester carboxylesterase